MYENMRADNYVNSGLFFVTIGKLELSFSKISGIGQTTEYDTYVEGGGRMHLLPKPTTAAGTITFEQGMTVVDRKTAEVFLAGGEIQDITIHLKKYKKKWKDDRDVESYYIESGLVVSWELGDLDAITPGVAIKKISLAHTGLIPL